MNCKLQNFFLDQTRLSVWVLDGDPGHANLLRFALSQERFPHTLVMLVAAMTTPWAILDQLQAWAALLGDHIDKLPLDNDTRQRCRQFSKQNLYISTISTVSTISTILPVG